jgi:hypothetical protein
VPEPETTLPPHILVDRRGAVRRTGDLVPAEVSATEAAPGAPAWVVDRSRTGLRLAVPEPARVNALLRVRSRLYPDCAPWVLVRVRSCQLFEDCWLVGCEFVEPQPWAILLTFG